jgi:hypothetical protein
LDADGVQRLERLLLGESGLSSERISDDETAAEPAKSIDEPPADRLKTVRVSITKTSTFANGERKGLYAPRHIPATTIGYRE